MHSQIQLTHKGSIVKLCSCSSSGTRTSFCWKKLSKLKMVKISTFFFNIWMLIYMKWAGSRIFWRIVIGNIYFIKLPKLLCTSTQRGWSIEILNLPMFLLINNAKPRFAILDSSDQSMKTMNNLRKWWLNILLQGGIGLLRSFWAPGTIPNQLIFGVLAAWFIKHL